MLSFTNAYSGYNHIRFDPLDAPKITFMLNHDNNNYYNVMPFVLKNNGATSQRLMDVVLAHQIRRNIEVYVDDMIVKIMEGHSHTDDLKDILQSAMRYDMHLNPAKSSFGVQ